MDLIIPIGILIISAWFSYKYYSIIYIKRIQKQVIEAMGSSILQSIAKSNESEESEDDEVSDESNNTKGPDIGYL